MVQDYWTKGEDSGQNRKISAKVGRKSAKVKKYQPKWGRNQPK
ncbi:hypothetical protein AAHB53_01110 [Niallia circulans]